MKKDNGVFLLSRKFQDFLSAGFSMTEVMVGGAILAGVALAGAQMFKEQRKAQTKVDQDQEILIYHQRLTKALQDEKNCSATFQGAWNMTPAQVAAHNISAIYSCTTCTVQNFDYDASSVARNATIISENSYIDPLAQMWRVTDISWGTPPNAATGNAVLKVTYGTDPAWPGSRAKKVYSVSKDINVQMRFTQHPTDPNLRYFKECISPKESSINNLQNDICGSMTQVTSTGNVMVWSDATQGCVARGPLTTGAVVKACDAPNMVIDGINSDGTVRCKMLTDGVKPDDDFMHGSGCLPGSSIRMEYDVVLKRLKAVCY